MSDPKPGGGEQRLSRSTDIKVGFVALVMIAAGGALVATGRTVVGLVLLVPGAILFLLALVPPSDEQAGEAADAGLPEGKTASGGGNAIRTLARKGAKEVAEHKTEAAVIAGGTAVAGGAAAASATTATSETAATGGGGSGDGGLLDFLDGLGS